MRKCSLTILVVLLVVALGLGAVACGSGGSATSKQTPQQMLTASVTAAKAATSQTGTYQIDRFHTEHRGRGRRGCGPVRAAHQDQGQLRRTG
jgi:hypothetical protein